VTISLRVLITGLVLAAAGLVPAAAQADTGRHAYTRLTAQGRAVAQTITALLHQKPELAHSELTMLTSASSDRRSR
jgi:hypothetical protein